MFRSIIVLAVIGAACAFTAPQSIKATALNAAKSKSVPFLEQPPALDGI
jgi:hypothetical protein